MENKSEHSHGDRTPANRIRRSGVVVCAVLALLVALLMHRRANNSIPPPQAANPSGRAGEAGADQAQSLDSLVHRPSPRGAAGNETAEQIVAGKLTKFAESRRELMRALARRHNIVVSPDIERFFDAVASGDWEQIEARFNAINGGDSSAGQASGRPPGAAYLWPAIIDAYGVAEQVHLWPAQKLLDYGKTILDAVPPGAVYVGGTDPGRWIPEFLNDTSDGERHIVVTQNGLADGTYLDYLRLLYDDHFKTLTPADAERAFHDYSADAQKRFAHDRDFPDEPKQVRPGEEIQMVDNSVRVSGKVAVMAINELLLTQLMNKNPDLPFALQESFPLKGTYANALPAGPLMELRAGGDEASFAKRAGEALDRWRTTADTVLSDPASSSSPAVLRTYSHDVAATANLLAAHQNDALAEEAYRLSVKLSPSNLEAVTGLAEVLARSGSTAEAERLLREFAQNYPKQRDALEKSRKSGSVTFSRSDPAK